MKSAIATLIVAGLLFGLLAGAALVLIWEALQGLELPGVDL